MKNIFVIILSSITVLSFGLIEAHKEPQLKASYATYKELRSDLKSKLYAHISPIVRDKKRCARDIEAFLKEVESIEEIKGYKQSASLADARKCMNELLRASLGSLNQKIHRPTGFYGGIRFDESCVTHAKTAYTINGLINMQNERYYTQVKPIKKAFGNVAKAWKTAPFYLLAPLHFLIGC